MKKLHDVKQDTEKLQYAAQQNENVEDGMEIPLIDGIKDHAYAVHDAAAQNQRTAAKAQHAIASLVYFFRSIEVKVMPKAALPHTKPKISHPIHSE